MDGPTFDQECLQRILSITAASLSIVSGISVLFWWFVILPYRQRYMAKCAPRLVAVRDRNEFRYHLTIALIIIDLLKAIILITYPIRYFNADTTNPQEQFPDIIVFCDVIGFLTVATIQSSDFAVLALAIHTALLIFGNSSSAGSSNKNNNHNNAKHNSIGSGDDRDKGLYRYRYYIYSVFFVILPLAIASIGMVNNAGYTYFISWCYLVIEPMWYSLLLSWIPRLLIMVLISIIYVSIFIQMKMRMYHVSQAIQRASNYNDDTCSSTTELTLWQSIKVVFRSSQRSIQRRRSDRFSDVAACAAAYSQHSPISLDLAHSILCFGNPPTLKVVASITPVPSLRPSRSSTRNIFKIIITNATRLSAKLTPSSFTPSLMFYYTSSR